MLPLDSLLISVMAYTVVAIVDAAFGKLATVSAIVDKIAFIVVDVTEAVTAAACVTASDEGLGVKVVDVVAASVDGRNVDMAVVKKTELNVVLAFLDEVVVDVVIGAGIVGS